MKPFYTEFLETLPASLKPDDAQELKHYIAGQITASTADQGASGSSPCALGMPQPTDAASIQNGEAVLPGAASGWNFDVFWCVGKTTSYPKTNDNEQLAEILYKGLVARQLKEHLGRIRLRRLPDIMNQTPRYEIVAGGVTIRSYPLKAKRS